MHKSTLFASICAIIIVAVMVRMSFYVQPKKGGPIPQTPYEVVLAFYKSYQDCLENPPTAASGQVSLYCQNNTGLTATDFSKNIDAGGIANLGADPIVCAQSLPQDLSLSASIPSGQMSSVVVREFFGVAHVDVRVSLREAGDSWRIFNIMCPRPDPASEPETINTWATYTNKSNTVSFKYPTSAGSNFPPAVKAINGGTQVTFRGIGSEFSFVTRPIKQKVTGYFENSVFQESNHIGSYDWGVSLSVKPAFVAYQMTQDDVQYIFVFPKETEKNLLQQSVISTFTFLDTLR